MSRSIDLRNPEAGTWNDVIPGLTPDQKMEEEKDPTESAEFADPDLGSVTTARSKEQPQTSDVKPGPSDPKSADQRLALLKEKNTKVEDPDFLKWVSDIVSSNPGVRVKTGGLEVTDYSEEELYEWGTFYLPDIVKMEVVGVVEGTSRTYDQLVLMTCEDRKVYAFDGEKEELHMVAESLEELDQEGLKYPSPESYYKGEAFKHMTEKDWDEVRNSPVGKKLDEEHRKLVEENKSELLECLQSI
ncbi:uncharacterized protein LOC120563553 isoform X1 [Perca fluviatilis]|uniref:uncharacterized protein LOC120563553 isoform X1 n=1 Tax=Perca fluviatilis TaxID=8168 RepID=UPI0019650C0D|nr:uncharacterized protein LOC120563553 isoform X1 [Perca fluviatilis]